MNTQQLIAEAIELPVEDRALVVNSLLNSLNPSSGAIDRQWLDVARQRLDEINAGKVIPVPAEAVFAKIWNRFDK
ncbi:addiction module protein [Cellvibrio mixtus]|uniref:addiction module protein n=1 Tax=Cellvibrio mixtus TaxID=39650 RepID=UPI00058665D5|nr:addiction module protein [Cellvibrio mixtus]